MTYDPAWSATVPMAHQVRALEACLPRPAFALFMEQGTGKTKILLDKTVALYLAGEIDGLLVIAPNGVHRNWIVEEAPKHLPANLKVCMRAHRSGMGKRQQAHFDEIYQQHSSLRILALNVEALSTPTGAKIAGRFLRSGRMHTVVDESTSIKTVTTKRTRNTIALGKLSLVRSIATGTPVTQGPLDLYSQFEFLRPGYLGPNYTVFKNRYAVWTERIVNQYGKKHKFKELVRYRNLDELIRKCGALSFTATKKQCLDLPPKVYVRRPVELEADQLQAYRALVKSTLVEFSDTERISTPHVLTRLLRLQQIVGGFLQLDRETGPRALTNAKLASLEEMLEDMDRDSKVIIWARFLPELHAITRLLREQHGHHSVACYWGECSVADRARAILAFQGGDAADPVWMAANGITELPPPARFFVGQQRAGGKGLTLHAASQVIYFSNTYSYEDRIQSEDRAHRIGQEKSVTYTDLVAEGTIDEKLLRALRDKRDMADMFRNVGELLS